jgi:hypothetical protein
MSKLDDVYMYERRIYPMISLLGCLSYNVTTLSLDQ